MTKNLKLSQTIESVKAYTKIKLEVLLPDSEFGWTFKLTEDQEEVLKKDLKKRIEDGKEWKHIAHETVFNKMKTLPLKTEIFTPDLLEDQPTAIIMMSEALIKALGLDKVKQKQQKLEMPAK
jgi:hypothetical protein